MLLWIARFTPFQDASRGDGSPNHCSSSVLPLLPKLSYGGSAQLPKGKIGQFELQRPTNSARSLVACYHPKKATVALPRLMKPAMIPSPL